MPNRVLPSAENRSKSDLSEATLRGFSLTELLVVMAVILLLLGVSVTSLQDVMTGGSIRAAVDLAAGAVDQARTEALIAGEGARIVVDADPSSNGYLRRIAVLRGVRNESGAIEWKMAARPVTLPKGTFFFEEDSDGFESMQFDFESGPDGTSYVSCRFYEYDRQGRLVSAPGGGQPRMVFGTGILNGAGQLDVPESSEIRRLGFVLRPSGSVTFFESADQIDPTTS